MGQKHQAKTKDQNQEEAIYMEIPLELIEVKDQVRKRFSEQEIGELALSISEVGVINPILVARGENGKYRVIAGHRRVLAAKMANLEKIPAIVIDSPDWEEQIFLQLAENIQRENLHPFDEAEALHLIREKTYYSHFEIAQKIGKDRTYVTKMLSLVKLFKFLDKYPQLMQLSKRELFQLASGKSDEEIEKKLQERFNGQRQRYVAVRSINCSRNVKMRVKSKMLTLEDVEDEKFAKIAEYLTELFGWWHKIKIFIEVE